MSQQIPSTAELLDASDVAAYLQRHPDFFHHRDDLLRVLYVPHDAPRGTVSLVERQIYLLRQQNNDLRQRLNQLMDIARDNDRLFEKTRRLVLDLLDSATLEEVVGAVEDSLRYSFQVPYSSLLLFSYEPLAVGRSVRAEEAWENIGGLLSEAQGVCGILQPHELDFLFEQDSLMIGSAAVVRIGHYGVLAIGSPDPNHYKSTLGTLFLGHIADVLARTLPRFSARLESLI